ncbi:hypothetical protein BC936DRAFT_141671 [Jimgerdemannia flammicorona]|uniref:Protein kinase domain-containing protein n=1 Tax=Jimgerdemannia flammicorona TaxID=994334 RepID=A0A433DFW0_9FUNG|nr:hypothetical protein BC936DRAFT_141671 [Jimgerdemannia flammicorona]
MDIIREASKGVVEYFERGPACIYKKLTANSKSWRCTSVCNHLVWIPPDEFMEVEFLSEGEFAKVYKGITKNNITKGHEFAMKELKRSMGPELALNIFLRAEGIAVVDLQSILRQEST